MAERQTTDDQVGSNTDESPDATSERPRTEPRPAEERHPFRAWFGRHRGLDLTYRIVIGVVGTAVVVGGLALVPLPGPGWLIVFFGLAILATEFAWAGRVRDYGLAKFRGWTEWVTEQSLLVRALIGLAGLLVVAGAVWAYVAIQGVPGWLPLG